MMYGYDRQLSEVLAKKYPQLIEEQACYNNVYHLVTSYLDELKPWDQIRVLYCYRKGPDSRYYRHAFVIFDGKLLEPLPYLDMSCENRQSIIPIREMSFSEYLELICEEAETELRESLYQADLDAVKKNGIFRMLNPFDLASLYRKIDDDWLNEEQGAET